MGMKAAAKVAFGSDSLEGKKIAVQGVGQVGKYLVDHLVKENARVVITDISETKVKEVAIKHNLEVVPENEIYDVDMDIF